MSELTKYRSEQEAVRASAERATVTRYSEAVSRYLGAVGYRPDEPSRQAPAPVARTGGMVVVGADDTPSSYIALDHAAIEAELRGWDLRIVHVLSPGGRHDPGYDSGSRLLERLTDRVHAHSSTVAVSSRLVVGSASGLLLSEALTADLVVVGHRQGVAATAFGMSVGDRVAAAHRGTVLVVRVPGWPPGAEFARRPIVVGVDHAPGPAVAFAMEEARARDCDVVMVHAGAAAEKADRFDIVGGVRVHHRNVAKEPAAALVRASGEAAALVVGRTGMLGVPGALGSVSRAMVQHAHCPVFLVG